MMENYTDKISDVLKLTGARYWTTSLLPVLVGSTLPFWLNPPGFQFSLQGMLLFLIGTLSGHCGFSLLFNAFNRPLHDLLQPKNQLFISGIACLAISILIGAYINSTLQFHDDVPEYIFIIYGITVLFTGVLYTAPPFNFYRNVFGELIAGVGLGMLPVLGAYLIQVGDITRTVYLASLPIVLSTGLWIWIIELANRHDYKRSGYKPTPMHFPIKFSGRYIPLLLILAIYFSLILAVLARSSLSPISLIALLSSPFGLIIVKLIWWDYENNQNLKKANKYAFLIHLSICVIIIASSLSTIFMDFASVS